MDMEKSMTNQAGKPDEKPKKIGRPTRYTEDMPDKLLEFFDVPLDRVVKVQNATASGKVVESEITKPNRLPTVEGFCAHHKMSKRTFHDWVQKYPSFAHALGKCKQLQMNHLIQHSLEGTYHAGFAKFLAINISEYREKIEHDHKEVEIKVVLPDERAKQL